MRSFRLLLLLLFCPPSLATDNVMLDVGTLSSMGWRLEGIRLALTGISGPHQQLVLTIKKLALPKPFDDLKLADFRCESFNWGDNRIVCRQGKARIDSKHWRSPRAAFSFRLSEKSGRIKITGLRLFGGRINAELNEEAAGWQVKLTATQIDGALLQKQLGFAPVEIKKGAVNLVLLASGVRTGIGTVDATVRIDRLTLQTPDGKTATETLSSTARISAHRDGSLWHWRLNQQLTGGALYAEPVYLEAGHENIGLTGQGVWNTQQQRIDVESFAFDHAGTAALRGRALLDAGTAAKVVRAKATLRSDNLARFWPVYLQPFVAQTALEGLSLQGKAQAELAVENQALTNLALNFSGLAVKDENGRFGAEGGKGAIRWAEGDGAAIPSTIGWQGLSLYSLPIGLGQLTFSAQADRIELLQEAQLPFLGGDIRIDRFRFQGRSGSEPDVYFAGSLNHVSLEQLTGALKWTPLSGTVSGRIPGIEYRGNTLKLGGELNIQAFDGRVDIKDVAASGLFGDFPRLSAEIEFDRLDLDQITSKFRFGGITGRLSGFVKNLQLENWRPAGFYAWFGTPDDDDSRHRISQKAVQNIANIGGGGAADLLSRSFLRFFDTFGYDKIGLGCYLHDGVCQMMGLEAAETGGYRIIKGGGLPRIDVIGYNPRIDWTVLIERLQRITEPEEVIIK